MLVTVRRSHPSAACVEVRKQHDVARELGSLPTKLINLLQPDNKGDEGGMHEHIYIEVILESSQQYQG